MALLPRKDEAWKNDIVKKEDQKDEIILRFIKERGQTRHDILIETFVDGGLKLKNGTVERFAESTLHLSLLRLYERGEIRKIKTGHGNRTEYAAEPGPVPRLPQKYSRDELSGLRTCAELGVSLYYLTYHHYFSLALHCTSLASDLVRPRISKIVEEIVGGKGHPVDPLQDAHHAIERSLGQEASSSYDLTRFSSLGQEIGYRMTDDFLNEYARETAKERIIAELAGIDADENVYRYLKEKLPVWVKREWKGGNEAETTRYNFRVLFQLLNKYAVEFRSVHGRSDRIVDFFSNRPPNINSPTFGEMARVLFTFPIGTVTITGGTKAFKNISKNPKEKIIRPNRGEPITGTIELTTVNRMMKRAVAPLVQVASWLPPREGWAGIDLPDPWIREGRHSYSIPVNLEAPTAPNDTPFHLIFAFRGETHPAYVASSTHSHSFEEPIWDDGNDLAYLPPRAIREGQTDGHTWSNEEFMEFGYAPFDLPLDAVAVDVS